MVLLTAAMIYKVVYVIEPMAKRAANFDTHISDIYNEHVGNVTKKEYWDSWSIGWRAIGEGGKVNLLDNDYVYLYGTVRSRDKNFKLNYTERNLLKKCTFEEDGRFNKDFELWYPGSVCFEKSNAVAM